MDRSLRLLLLLQSKSLFRQLGRLFKTKRGVFVAITLAVVTSIMALPLAMSLFAGSKIRENFDFRSFELYLTFGMCFMTITQLTQRSGHGIYFSPAEIENLFTAPISRKQLLGYRMFVELRQSIMASAFGLVAGAIYLPNLFCGLVGMVLVMSFARMLPVLFAILSQTASAQMYTLRRRAIGYALLAVLAFAVLSQISTVSIESTADFNQLLHSIADSWIGSTVLWPFRIFARATFSEFPDLRFLFYAGLSLTMVSGVAFAVFWADANYFSVVEKTAKVKLQQLKQLKVGALKKEYKFSLPMLPFARGIGPLVWRQTLSTIRANTNVLPVLFLLIVGLSYVVIFHNDIIQSEAFPPIFLSSLGYISLIMAMGVPIGFKADIQKMENLKSLPFSDWTIVVGQTFAATAITSALQIAIISVVTIVNFDRVFIWILGAVGVWPINYLMISGSSIILLLFPVKSGQDGSTTVTSIGQAFISMLSLITLMGSAVGIVAGVSVLTYFLSRQVALTVALGGLSLLFVLTALTAMLKLIYGRFDVSRDTPV